MSEHIYEDSDMENERYHIIPFGSMREEIVRCKDCKHFGRHIEEPWDKCELHSFTIGPNDGKEQDGFCKWGEESDPGASHIAGGRSHFSDSAVRIGTEPRHDMDYSIFVTGTSTDAELVRYVPERTCHNLNEPGYNYFHCSMCGEKTYCSDQRFTWCPTCGARIVNE